MFDLTNVSVNYGDAQALAPTSLSLARRQTLVLIGPSGAGKSTLLRVFAGLVRASGSVRFDGAEVADWQAVRLRLGYVIQDGGLFPHLTAAFNITLMAREIGWDSDRIAARINELAALVGLPVAVLDRFPAELSGGQRQRVGIMRALMLDPDVLLLDEPLSALDPITRAHLAAELKELFRTLDKTVVLVTHSLGEARYFAGRIVLMRGGVVVQDGSFDDLDTAPANPFVREFIDAERAL